VIAVLFVIGIACVIWRTATGRKGRD